MNIRAILCGAALGALVFPLARCTPGGGYEAAIADFERETGLHPAPTENDSGALMEGVVQSYPVLFHPAAGNVWGRYAARVAMGEVGPLLGRVGRFLTGSYEHVGSVTGSPLDRVLSRVIGQPLAFF